VGERGGMEQFKSRGPGGEANERDLEWRRLRAQGAGRRARPRGADGGGPLISDLTRVFRISAESIVNESDPMNE